ncbi:hypothetical protein BUALT_Bualt15G0069100 [Buddleja alternifolia]|uniref:Uncharacterized protein n=1 Tax=Buddleja alternifolia TaxID=168488 RepID=A0AAV6WJW1_9LAMI|nr:hypothetical protein BUALT_Bualt15G0069100 [Buddleja alternifolia]
MYPYKHRRRMVILPFSPGRESCERQQKQIKAILQEKLSSLFKPEVIDNLIIKLCHNISKEKRANVGGYEDGYIPPDKINVTTYQSDATKECMFASWWLLGVINESGGLQFWLYWLLLPENLFLRLWQNPFASASTCLAVGPRLCLSWNKLRLCYFQLIKVFGIQMHTFVSYTMGMEMKSLG